MSSFFRPKTSLTMLEALKSDDPDVRAMAILRFQQRYEGLIMHWITTKHVMPLGVDPEDLANAVFMELCYKSLLKFEYDASKGRFCGYIRRTILYQRARLARKYSDNRLLESEKVVFQLVREESSVDCLERWVGQQDVADFWKIVARVAFEDCDKGRNVHPAWEFWWLHRIEYKRRVGAYKEICLSLDLKEATVRKRVQRMKDKLLAELSGAGITGFDQWC